MLVKLTHRKQLHIHLFPRKLGNVQASRSSWSSSTSSSELKASFAKKAELATEELRHLQKFENIVLITLPAHPLYKKADEEVLELEDHLPDAKKRLKELEEVSHIKLPSKEFVRISGSIATFNAPKTQQILESRLASIDDAMLLHEPLSHLERMSEQQEKCPGSPTTNATAMPILVPTLLSPPSNKNVRSWASLPGIVSGNGNNSKSRPDPRAQIAKNQSMNGSDNGKVNGVLTEEGLLISSATGMNLFEPQEQSSSEEKSIDKKAWSPVSTHCCFSKSNGDVQRVTERISQGSAGNGNVVHGSERPTLSCNEDEEDTESMYSSSTNASTKRAFDSAYDDDTSSQDSQSGDDSLSVDSIFSDKGYEWHWVKAVASEAVETRSMNQVISNESKKRDGLTTPLDALSISTDLQFAAPNDAPFATSDAQTGDKARPLEEEDVEETYEDLTPVMQINAFPVKWSSIPFSHSVEGQSDYSDSTVEQKLPASPGQTTFCNPVFDFNPLEGNGMSSEVNMLQKLQDQKLDALLGDFGNVRSPVHNIVGEPSKTDNHNNSKDLMLTHIHENGRKGALQGIPAVSKSSKWRESLECQANLTLIDEDHRTLSKCFTELHAGLKDSHLTKDQRHKGNYWAERESCLQGSSISNMPQTDYDSCNLQVSCSDNKTDLRQEMFGNNFGACGIDDLPLLGNDVKEDFLLLENRNTGSLDGKLACIVKDLERRSTWANQKLEEHASQVSCLKKHVDTWMLKLNAINANEYVTAEQLNNVCTNFKVVMDGLYNSKSNDLHSFQEKVIRMFKDLEASDKKWKDSELEAKVDEEILHIAEVFSERQEKITAELKQAIFQLKEDCKGMLEWKREAQGLSDVTRQNIEELQIKSMSQAKDMEKLCTVLQFNDFQKKTSHEMASIRQLLDKVAQDDTCCEQAALQLELTVNAKLNKLQAIIKQNVEDVSGKLTLLDEFQLNKKDLEARWRHEREKERALMMDKLETLSRLYLGGLDELRMSLLNLKVGFGSKIEELAKCLDLPCHTRLGVHVSSEQIEEEVETHPPGEVKIAYAQSQLVDFPAAKEDSSVCTKEYNDEIDKNLSTQSSSIASQKIVGSEVEGSIAHSKRMKPKLSTIKDTDKCNKIPLTEFQKSISFKQGQQEQESCNTATVLTEGKDIVNEIMLELLGIVERAKEMLGQIADAKKQSIKIAEEMVRDSASLKKTTTGLGQAVIQKMECQKRESIGLFKEAVNSLEKKNLQPWSACTADIAVNKEGSTDLERMNVCCFESQEQTISENASCSGKLLSELVEMKSLTLHFLGKAAAEVVALEDSQNNLLELMNANNSQPYAKVHKAVQDVVRKLQEGESLDVVQIFESWEKVIDDDKAKMRCVIKELKELKARVSCIIGLGSAFTQELDQYLRNNCSVTIGKAPCIMKIETKKACECKKTDKIETQQEVMKQDVNCLNEKFINMASMLEELKSKTKATAQADVYVKQLFESSQKMQELGRKMIKLESLHHDVAKKVREIQLKTRDAEASTAAWGPKYETATRILNELETRIRSVESLLWHKTEKLRHSFPNRSQLLCLYIDETSVPKDANSEHIVGSVSNEHSKEKEVLKKPENRMITLETRIEHVASAAYANLRILDAKVERISIGIRTALEGAAMAEKKCNALGAELVKVFRSLARPSKPKFMNNNKANDGRHSRCAIRRPNTDTGKMLRASSWSVAQQSRKASSLKSTSSIRSGSKEGRNMKMNVLSRKSDTFTKSSLLKSAKILSSSCSDQGNCNKYHERLVNANSPSRKFSDNYVNSLSRKAYDAMHIPKRSISNSQTMDFSSLPRRGRVCHPEKNEESRKSLCRNYEIQKSNQRHQQEEVVPVFPCHERAQVRSAQQEKLTTLVRPTQVLQRTIRVDTGEIQINYMK